ncbi:MAG: FAD-dependent oxidoreductase [Euryarchaeota archaeon]|nr:FAD-dependent oxidoreductase [Euryarchaeota archaeon]
MRLTEHPILDFEKKRGKKIHFLYDKTPVEAYDTETIASALHAAGVKVLSFSSDRKRPRGFYCAIGKCASCIMSVNGVPNTKTCMTLAEEGMKVEHQQGLGSLTAEKIEKTKEGEMKAEVAIVGGGPAGLCAALEAAEGHSVVLIDENYTLGGQLIKQTHKFFGSKNQRASVRGIKIAEDLCDRVLENKNIEVLLDTSVIGYYNDEEQLVAVKDNGTLIKLDADTIIVAVGAMENTLVFEDNDLPGIYGAGAVQTLMNVYGVKPGDRVLMVGAGNVGLIVSYQLLQAGVDVACVVEALPEIGGYHVHAAKLRRCGVPILTRHSILKAYGDEEVTGARIVQLNENWSPIKGTEKDVDADIICLAVGLCPSIRLLRQMGCSAKYIPELGGSVIVHNQHLETEKKGVYVAGDCAGIGEASTAMLEGKIAGLSAVLSFGEDKKLKKRRKKFIEELQSLRQGPFGETPKRGKKKIFEVAE